MAAPNKIVISLDPEFKTLLKSIDRNLERIARSRSQSFTITNPPARDETTEEAGN